MNQTNDSQNQKTFLTQKRFTRTFVFSTFNEMIEDHNELMTLT